MRNVKSYIVKGRRISRAFILQEISCLRGIFYRVGIYWGDQAQYRRGNCWYPHWIGIEWKGL